MSKQTIDRDTLLTNGSYYYSIEKEIYYCFHCGQRLFFERLNGWLYDLSDNDADNVFDMPTMNKLLKIYAKEIAGNN